MQRLKVGIPPGFDPAIVDLVLRRHLRDATGEEYEIGYEVTFDYGGFALIESTDSETHGTVDGAKESVVIQTLAPALEFLDKADPQGALRRLSSELKTERAKTEDEIEGLVSEFNQGEHSR